MEREASERLVYSTIHASGLSTLRAESSLYPKLLVSIESEGEERSWCRCSNEMLDGRGNLIDVAKELQRSTQ